MANILSFLLLIPVYFYRWFISPLTPPSCRHIPTCSQYAIDAFRSHNPVKALLISSGRILRCRPGGTHGYDPVPRFIFRRYRPLREFLSFRPKCNRLKEHD
ncbi:MAG: membrane protein insertion efficiency factor YidD [Bacteroidales bacterium]|nr:membrane protein insertion efficiency factor YidD [Bacteroidales bacterium]